MQKIDNIMTKVRLVYGLWVIVIAVLVLAQCKRDKPMPVSYSRGHKIVDIEAFNKLSRAEQVKACAKCHQQIYENEMNGPHANAFKNLTRHLEYVKSESYADTAYKQLLAEENGVCISCHTGTALFETAFAGMASEADLKKSITAGKKIPAGVRSIANDNLTGVDCITCHYNGKSVVTSATFIPTNDTSCPAYCSPQPSALFSSNYSCFPCHFEQVESVDEYYTENRAATPSCVSCHNEYDNRGKSTHYTYWAHNTAGRKLPDHANIFHGINVTYDSDRKSFRVVWVNKVLPHPRSVCTELIAVVDVMAGGRRVSDTIRLNRKSERDTMICNWYKNTPVPGLAGVEFGGMNDSILKYIPAPWAANAQSAEVKISGYKKEQYWLNDSIHSDYLSKSYRVLLR